MGIVNARFQGADFPLRGLCNCWREEWRKESFSDRTIDSNVKIENLLTFQNLGTRSFKKKEMKRLPLIVIREVIAFHWFIYKNRKFLNFTIMKNFQRNLISKKNDIILITICEIITIY